MRKGEHKVYGDAVRKLRMAGCLNEKKTIGVRKFSH